MDEVRTRINKEMSGVAKDELASSSVRFSKIEVLEGAVLIIPGVKAIR